MRNSINMTILRPLSPHLPIYKPQLTSTFPISHRISGAFLATIVFFWYLLCLKIGWICFTYENFYLFLFYSKKKILIPVGITDLALSYHPQYFIWAAIYWQFIYLSIYISIRWKVYERTKEWITRACLYLFRRIQKAFTLEGEALLFCFRNCFLITSFGVFFWIYPFFFPEDKGGLVNPLLVIGQLSCLFYYFTDPSVRARYTLSLSFLLSILSSLYLLGIDCQILAFAMFLFILLMPFFPVDSIYILIFMGYFLDPWLAKWGFFLAFQLVGHYTLLFFLEKELLSSTSKKRCLSLIFLLILQFIHGFVYYEDFALIEPMKHLAALLSGACIIFISLKRRTPWSSLIAFFLYFFFSILIGIKVAPSDKTFLGIPEGIFIFGFLHLWVPGGVLICKGGLPRRIQPLVPLFICLLFKIIGYLPELAWLGRWMEGMDLLLLLLAIFFLVAE